MAKRNDILAWCDEVLQVGMFKDYAPNGLQVEGRAEVGKIATSVTASKAAVDFAAEQGADMLLVHHGMFWKSEPEIGRASCRKEGRARGAPNESK